MEVWSMVNDNDPAASKVMFRAEKLARERGYFEMPASKLLRIAQERWEKSIKSARAPSETAVSVEIENNLLEYTAVTTALSHNDYVAHVEAMAKFDRSDRD